MLIKGMTPQEIRVLQEYRRIGADTMTLDAIKALKHPSGGGDAPAMSLEQKGFLSADEGRQNFSLTDKAKEFLAFEPKPELEESGGGDAGATE